MFADLKKNCLKARFPTLSRVLSTFLFEERPQARSAGAFPEQQQAVAPKHSEAGQADLEN